MAVQKLGIPTGPAMVLTVPGRKTDEFADLASQLTVFRFDPVGAHD